MSPRARTVIDEDKGSGWAVDPQFEDHAAILTLKEPLYPLHAFEYRRLTEIPNISWDASDLCVHGSKRPLLSNTISEEAALVLAKPAGERSVEETRQPLIGIAHPITMEGTDGESC